MYVNSAVNQTPLLMLSTNFLKFLDLFKLTNKESMRQVLRSYRIFIVQLSLLLTLSKYSTYELVVLTKYIFCSQQLKTVD